MRSSSPRVTVIIPVFYGRRYLERCFKGILDTDYENMEIVVVDSGSKDGSVEYIREIQNCSRHKIVIITLGHNPGACAARNIGTRYSTGEILAFLDQDATPKADWLKTAIPYFLTDEKLGVVQCKLLLLDNKSTIDSLGYYLDSNTLFPIQLVAPGRAKDRNDFRTRYIFGVKGAGMLVRKRAFFEAGTFDDDYFFWYEENDICWRIWRAGYSVMLVPDSTVYHMWGSRKETFSNQFEYTTFFYAPRNYMLTVLKNAEISQLLNVVIHFFCWLALVFVSLLKKKGSRAALLVRAIFWILKNMREIILKRRDFTKMCKVPRHVYVKESPAYLYRVARSMVG